ncbi:hypothetical protein I6N95_23810 [Vagococcus sp. BWB3-3]|uniref:Uncharacterized protein n=1 Tax=Vagococcus allomyrinae TaxID=2794353 RepID=A0A940SX80_9ENTE|nr:hypothetical protein [Vagococcus allomyrinae]MBP1044040.1 hypothetical protein [Vagococcus allomyrinae]
MELKRFIQLFLVYTLSIFIPLLLISWLNITRFLSMLMVLVLVGYFVMTVPLTMMTLKKKK